VAVEVNPLCFPRSTLVSTRPTPGRGGSLCFFGCCLFPPTFFECSLFCPSVCRFFPRCSCLVPIPVLPSVILLSPPLQAFPLNRSLPPFNRPCLLINFCRNLSFKNLDLDSFKGLWSVASLPPYLFSYFRYDDHRPGHTPPDRQFPSVCGRLFRDTSPRSVFFSEFLESACTDFSWTPPSLRRPSLPFTLVIPPPRPPQACLISVVLPTRHFLVFSYVFSGCLPRHVQEPASLFPQFSSRRLTFLSPKIIQEHARRPFPLPLFFSLSDDPFFFPPDICVLTADFLRWIYKPEPSTLAFSWV